MQEEEVDKTIEDEVEVEPSNEDKAIPSENTPSARMPEPTADETEYAGQIFEKRGEKSPLFVVEPRKPGCERDDKMLLLSKKVGFFGLILFLILSIVMGAVNKVWQNSLNLLFMALAVLSYGVQDMLHLKAISRCRCNSCTAEKRKLKNIIILCVTVFAVLVVLFGVKQFATF